LGKRYFLLFFYLPFLGFIALFLIYSSVNRGLIRDRMEHFVEDQLRAQADILKADILRSLESNMDPQDILNLYDQAESIHFMALLDSTLTPVDWITRFEGYLPLASQQNRDKDSWIIDSPVGKIFNLLSPVQTEQGQAFYLYLGYSLQNLESMLARSKRMLWILLAVMGGVGVLFYIGLFQIQNRYVHKVRELDEQIRQKERFREISAFTSGVAHEIKNPLNRLSLIIELMQKKGDDSVKPLASKGKAEVKVIAEIIDRFSAALKPLRIKREMIRLVNLMEEIMVSLNNRYPDADITFSPENKVSFRGDRGLMRQALTNVIENAVEAAGEGEVRVTAAYEKPDVRIMISDTGPGIRPEDVKHIFEPFFSRKNKGMGVGLFLTRKIIEAHGGCIRLFSSRKKGTVFAITLPGE
jgi:signal transduction histidine kinase